MHATVPIVNKKFMQTNNWPKIQQTEKSKQISKKERGSRTHQLVKA